MSLTAACAGSWARSRPRPFTRSGRNWAPSPGGKFSSTTKCCALNGAEGTSLGVPSDLDQLAREFKRLAPEDSALIDQLVRDARRCAPLEPPLENPMELMNAFEKTRLGLRYLPMVPAVLRYKNLPITTLCRPLPKQNPARGAAAHRRQRGHVGAGAGDVAGVSDAEQHRLRGRRLVGFCDGHRGPLHAPGRHGAV